MNEHYQGAPDSPGVSELEGLREMSVYLLTMGIALIVLGTVAIGSSFVATIATMGAFGILLLVGAIFQVVTAFWGRHWRGFFLHLLAGVLYLVAGLFMIDAPLAAALALTLMVAACLLVGGILRVVVSLVERFEGWGWSLLSGIVSLLLGTAIWRQWPSDGLWVIGLFVGIEMLFSGLSWVMLALAVRSTRKAVLAA